MYTTIPLPLRVIYALPFFITTVATAQATFDVASIHPTSEHVQFESNGTTEVAYGTLKMHDVTVATCIYWAYGTPATADPRPRLA